MNEHIYTKCKHCHLFVDENWVPEGFGDIAPYVHLHRGDEQDERLEGTHDAEPSDEAHTLDYWREHGPIEMRLRFVVADIEKAILRHRYQSPFDKGVQMGLQDALDRINTLR